MSMELTFEKSLKPRAVEEYVDLVFFRPLAHLLIPLLHRLGITPNQVSCLSMLVGVSAAWAVQKQFFIRGALLALAAIVLDCCDGQLARLTNTHSELGRVVDGVCDMIWVTLLWVCIYTSGYFRQFNLPVAVLMPTAAFGIFVHVWRYDAVKLQYLELINPAFPEKALDFDQAVRLLKKEAKSGRFLSAFLLALLLFQIYFFVGGKKKKVRYDLPAPVRESLRACLDPVMNEWSWLGESMHNVLVVAGLLLAPLTPYGLVSAFTFILIPMNLWYFHCEWKWKKTMRLLKTEGLMPSG